MRRQAWVIIISALLWSGKLLAAPAPRLDLVDLPAGSVYEILVEEPIAEVWIPISPTEPNTGLVVAPRPIDVAFGNRHDDGLRGAFDVVLQSSTGQNAVPAGITLGVNLNELNEPGAYDVRLRMTGAGREQVLKLQVLVPAAQLRVDAAPILEATVGLNGVVDWESRGLVLSETSRRSWVTALGMTRVGTPSHSTGESVTGSIALAGMSTTLILPGASTTLDVEPIGVFPLGTSKGTIELRSRQLSTPVSLQYEVRSRRAHWWIAILIGCGLIVGYITRVWLAYRIELAETNVRRAVLRDRMEGEFHGRRDKVFRTKLRSALKLLDGLDTSDASKLSSGILDAERQLHEAIADLEQRRQTLQTRLLELMQVARTDWSVPVEAKPPLARCLEELVGVQATIDSGEIDSGAERFELIAQRHASEVKEVLEKWVRQVRERVFAFRDCPLEKQQEEDINPKETRVQDLLDEIPIHATHPRMKVLLDTTHAARCVAHDLTMTVRFQVRRLLQGVVSELSKRSVPAPTLERLAREWEGEPSYDVEGDMNWVASKGGQAKAALVAALAPYLDSSTRTESETAVAAAGYLKTARNASARSSGEGPLLGASKRDTTGTELEGAPARCSRVIQNPSPPVIVTHVLERIVDSRPLMSPQTKTMLAVAFAKATRWVLAGLGIVVLGYLVFEEKFVGTPRELIGIFFWGFTADVSVDALVANIAKQKA